MADFFDTTLAPHILGKEGGYVNNPNDAGGETIWGITVGVARENGYKGSMRLMTQAQAIAIYKSQFWLKPKYDQVALRSKMIAQELFDTAVNLGVARSSMFLQNALNAFNRQGKLYADIKSDGAIGNLTLSTLDTYLRVRGSDADLTLMKALEAQQGAHYLSISQSRQANEEFTYGWFANRIAASYTRIK